MQSCFITNKNKAGAQLIVDSGGKWMFYRFKTQNGKTYLTKMWIENGKRREKSIGPVDLMEKIMDEWRVKHGKSRLQFK